MSKPALTPTTDDEGLWTEAQAAAYVGIHQNALYRHRVAGTGPAFIVVTKSQVRYRPSVVKAWLKAREFSSMAAFYSADLERAHAVERQRQAASKARQTRWPKKPEAAACLRTGTSTKSGAVGGKQASDDRTGHRPI